MWTLRKLSVWLLIAFPLCGCDPEEVFDAPDAARPTSNLELIVTTQTPDGENTQEEMGLGLALRRGSSHASENQTRPSKTSWSDPIPSAK